MTRIKITYRLIVLISILLSNCKKKTDIHVYVYSPYANKVTSNATVELWQTKPPGVGYNLVHNGYGANEIGTKIATTTTDINGDAFFASEKLSILGNHKYFCIVKKNEFGGDCNCDVGRQYLTKGETNDIVLCEYNSGNFILRCNNLNNTQLGDSLFYTAIWLDVYDPRISSYIESSGSLSKGILVFDPTQYIWPTIWSQTFENCKGKLVLQVRKVKQNVATTFLTDTITIPSTSTPIITINW